MYVWSAEFDLELGGMESTLVWQVEYSSEEAVRSNAALLLLLLLFTSRPALS